MYRILTPTGLYLVKIVGNGPTREVSPYKEKAMVFQTRAVAEYVARELSSNTYDPKDPDSGPKIYTIEKE